MIRRSTFRAGAARLAAASALAAMLALPALPAQTLAQDATGSGAAVDGSLAAPAPLEPGDGASFLSWAEVPAFSWLPSEGAAEYQVVLNGGERTGPWVSREKWSPGDLGEGSFTWQVQARSQTGTSPLSAPMTFTVSASAAPAEPAAEPEPEPEAAAEPGAAIGGETPAEPAAAPAADAAAPEDAPAAAAGPTLALDAAAPLTVGQPITLAGAGFTPGESVTVRWLGDQGPVKGTATAAEDGSFAFGLEVPETPIGDRPVVAIGDSDGKQAVAWYVIAPTFTVAPAEARPGDTVTLTLLGYGPSEPWEVRWGEGEAAAWQSGETDPNGTARVQVQVPEGPSGPNTLVGVGMASGAALGTALTLLDPAADAAPAQGGDAAAIGGPTGDASVAPEPAPAPAPEPAAAPEPAPEPTVQGTTTDGQIVAPPASTVETSNDPAAQPEPAPEEKPRREKETNPNRQAREDAELAVANQMREQFGLPPIPPEEASAGAESAGAVGEDVSVDATMNGYLDPGASLAGAPAAAPAPSGAGEIVAAQETGDGGETGGEQIPIPSAVYDLLPNPEAIGAVERTPQDRREQRDDQREREQERRDRERERARDDGAAGDDGQAGDEHRTDDPGGSDAPAADAAPAPEPAPEPQPEPEPELALPVPPPGTVLTFIPAADTSTGADAPDDPQPEIQVTVLPLGGPDAAAAFVTFDVQGIGGGKVATATLTVTGAIGFWGPVSVTALPGYWVDEDSLTWNSAPGGEIQATGRDGGPSGYPELPADGVVSTDVTGVVTGDGLITFVLRGTPDVGQAIGSRESGIPAVLEIVTK